MTNSDIPEPPAAPKGLDPLGPAAPPGPVCGTARLWIETHAGRPGTDPTPSDVAAPDAAPSDVVAPDADPSDAGPSAAVAAAAAVAGDRADAPARAAGDDGPPAGSEAGPRHLAVGGGPGGRSWTGRRLALAGAAAVVAVVAVVGFVATRGSGPDDRQGGRPTPEDVAELAPRLLVTAEGWTVTAADELDVEHGETTATGPEGEITVMWTADGDLPGYLTYDETLADLTERAERLPGATIAGHEAALFQTGPAPLFFALWKDGDRSVGVAGRFASVDAFLEIAGTIEAVSVDDWLAALPDPAAAPDSPARNVGTVDEMLASVPLPAGFDRSALPADGGSGGSYQLGTQVIAAAACAWYDRWTEALAAGDVAAAGEAADALGTSPSWPVLHTMAAEGDWPQSVWALADAIAANGNGSGSGPASPGPTAAAAATAVC